MKATDLAKVQVSFWAAADELRADSKVIPVHYRDPVLDSVLLACADPRFEPVCGEVEAKARARNPATSVECKAKSVLYVSRIHADPSFAGYVIRQLALESEATQIERGE